MKYNYSFRKVYLENNSSILIMDLPKKIGLVTMFLDADVQSNGYWFIETIDKVLNGEEKYQEVGGNTCILQINPEYTTVIDDLSEDLTNNSCRIETSELRELIDIWLKKVNKK